jgi:hypothetical protein
MLRTHEHQSVQGMRRWMTTDYVQQDGSAYPSGPDEEDHVQPHNGAERNVDRTDTSHDCLPTRATDQMSANEQ